MPAGSARAANPSSAGGSLPDRRLPRHGGEHLERRRQSPIAVFANHLSYADANVVEVLLRRFGAAALAERLTAMAGPKVFSSRERRFSSLCFGTIKVPQSAGVSSDEAMLSSRDVARAARQSIEVARSRLAAGDVLLLFGEGRRSRTGAMQPMLPAVARYLDVPGTWVVPAGLSGSEALFPVGSVRIHASRAVIQIGHPFRAEALLACADGDRRLAVDAIGVAMADVLPASYRGVYGAGDDLANARRVLDDARRKN